MTVELLLNLLWLAIVIASAAQLAFWCSRQPPGARKWAVVIATACALAILFPIISVTDDLSNDATILEETRIVRRVAAVAAVHAVAAVVADTAPLLRSLFLQLALLTVLAAVATVARPGFATVFSFRGPPAAFAQAFV